MTINSKHFKKSEFACKCCGKTIENGELVAVLELVREHFGEPVTINSSTRCESHNADIGGAEHSQHLLGTAADIAVKNTDPALVYSYLDSVFSERYGIGRYQSFTHVDVRKDHARW